MVDSTVQPAAPLRHAYTPMKVAVGWMAGTFLLFLAVGEITKVPNLFKLSAFVCATIICFTGGYWLKMKGYLGQPEPEPISDTPSRVAAAKVVVAASALYYLAYGLTYMNEFGVLSSTAVVDAVLNPGAAYLAKFDVYANQTALGTTSLPAQVLTLLAVLSAPLIPLTFLYWQHLTGDVRLLIAVGLGAYILLFIAIGTQVGLGGIVIFSSVGYLAAKARQRPTGRSNRKLTARVVVALLAAAFAGYMMYNQSARLQAVGVQSDYAPNPIVQTVLGENLARGATVTAQYPTHGYLGLSYNLETRFEWTKGRGASRAIDSYLVQYGFAESVASATYPERTEARTGYPAGQLWATIYPWLASDLGWAGAVLFMGLVGWWMARWWHESLTRRSWLSLLLFAQMALLIAYVPANNQIGLSRPNLICLVTLLVLYAAHTIGRRVPSKRVDPIRRERVAW